jgi:Signal transduction histidine kinase
MRSKITLGHLFLLNQIVFTLLLLVVLGVTGTYLITREQKAVRERWEPLLTREVERLNNDFLSLETNVQRLKSYAELYEFSSRDVLNSRIKDYMASLISPHSTQYNSFFALGPKLAERYFKRPAYVYTVHRDYSYFASPKYNDSNTFVGEPFFEKGYDVDPNMIWWSMNKVDKKVNYSEFYFDVGYMEKVMFTTGTGIFIDGKLEGAVGIDTLAGDIAHKVGSVKLGETGGMILVDEKGRAILPLVSKNLPMIDYKYRRAYSLEDYKALPQLGPAMFDVSNYGMRTITGLDDEAYLALAKPMQHRPWYLVMYQKRSEAYLGLYYRLTVFACVALASYAVITMMLWWTGLYVMRGTDAMIAKLQESRDRAEAATKAKTSFLSTMSHEIRTPLNSMLGASDLLSETNLDKDQTELLRMMQGAGDTLLSVLNNILDFSKIESGKVQLEIREFHLSTLIFEIEEIFHSTFKRKGIEFILQHPSNDELVWGDSIRIKQILMNILGNAIKFTHYGQITLTVSWFETEQPGVKKFKFSIRDTGVGISPENLNTIFEEFQQEDSSVTRRFGGSGLGLSICRRLVQLMSGEISCESSPGFGSCFTIEIPMLAQTQNVWMKPTVSEVPLEIAIDLRQITPKRDTRVLIVDDMEENHRLLKAYMKKFAHVTLVSAYDGIDALMQLETAHFDLVIMDVQMPTLSGLETIGRLRELERSQERYRTPVIVISANNFKEDHDKSIHAGADEHYGKPVRKEQVFALLEKYKLV